MYTGQRHIQNCIIEFYALFRSLNANVVGLQFKIIAHRDRFVAFGDQLLYFYLVILIFHTEVLHQLFSFSHRNLGSRVLILQVVLRILLFEKGDVWQRQQLTLSRGDKVWLRLTIVTTESYMAHQFDYPCEGVLIVFDLRKLLLRTQENELRIELSRSSLHLNERFDCGELVQADDQIACADVETLLYDIGRDQNIYPTVIETVHGLLKFGLRYFYTLARGHLVQQILEDTRIFNVCWTVGLVYQTHTFEAHCEADLEHICIQQPITQIVPIRLLVLVHDIAFIQVLLVSLSVWSVAME